MYFCALRHCIDTRLNIRDSHSYQQQILVMNDKDLLFKDSKHHTCSKPTSQNAPNITQPQTSTNLPTSKRTEACSMQGRWVRKGWPKWPLIILPLPTPLPVDMLAKLPIGIRSKQTSGAQTPTPVPSFSCRSLLLGSLLCPLAC